MTRDNVRTRIIVIETSFKPFASKTYLSILHLSIATQLKAVQHELIVPRKSGRLGDSSR